MAQRTQPILAAKSNAKSFRLKNTQAGSEKFGPCECCGQDTDSTWLLVGYRNYTNHMGAIRQSHLIEKFGHRKCLAALTNYTAQ
jgi:hypothetical protein